MSPKKPPPAHLLVTKQSGQNNLYRVIIEPDSALKHARREVKRLAVDGYELTDRKKYGLAVIFRAAALPLPDERFAIVEVYEMAVIL